MMIPDPSTLEWGHLWMALFILYWAGVLVYASTQDEPGEVVFGGLVACLILAALGFGIFFVGAAILILLSFIGAGLGLL